ncbi:MAG: DUF2892 domain-containing protein [Gammaproteobacteria bacterium]|nr:DUF2892 domain-containing protein [Gammaproteobacteria bacterium]
MKANIGGIDKVLRIIVGALLIVATVAGMIGPWGWIGIVPLATGLINWCPLYRILGIRTTGASVD